MNVNACLRGTRGKVLLAGKFYPPQYMGGIEFALQDLASGLMRSGVAVDVIVSSRNGKDTTEVVSGVNVHRVGRVACVGSMPISPGYFGKMRRLLGENRYDAVHLQFPYPVAELSCLLSRKARLIITYHMHSEYSRMIKKPYIPFMHMLFRKADRIIVTSRAYLEEAEHLKSYRDKCAVIPLFINEGWFDPPSAIAVSRIKASYSPYVLYAGRLVEPKGVRDLLRAARDFEHNLVFAGEGPDLAVLKDLARDLGIGKKVFFVGPLEKDRLKEFFYAADIFCLPSHKESFGFVLLEAMAAGVPVVSTALRGGTACLNIHGETGLVVPPGDPEGIQRAVRTIAGDERLRLRMAAAARKRAEENFGERPILREITRLYGIE